MSVSRGELQKTFSSTKLGFSIQKPDATWNLTTKSGPAGSELVSMGPPAQTGKVALTIQVSVATVTSEAAMRERLGAFLKEIIEKPGIHASKARDFQVGAFEVPGLELEQESEGVKYLVRQAYVLSQGMQYKFQFHAPLTEYSGFAALFEKALASFTVLSLEEAVDQAMQLRALAARCGSEVQWMTDWEKASRLAQQEGKLILVTVSTVSGFDVGDQIGRGPFMDLDVLRLVQSRFVVLRWRKGMGAPFERQEVFGLGPSTFGTGLLVVNPKGEVKSQVFLLNPVAVYDVLLDALSNGVGLSVPPAPEGFTRQQGIEFLLHTGQLEAAKAFLAKADMSENPVEELALNSELQRLRRNGQEALTNLRAAISTLDLGSWRRGALRQRFRLTLAGLLASTGSAEASERVLQGLLDERAESSPATLAQALLLLGSLRYQAGDTDGTEQAWLRLTNEHSGSRWAWSAAAAMTGPAWGLDIHPNLEWPKPAHNRLAQIPELASDGSRSLGIDEMKGSAADFLIASQEQDGSWVTLRSYGKERKLGDEFELAATAIDGRALLRLIDRADAQAAARKALDWMLARRALLEKLAAPPVVFMDYAVWSRSYAIFFLADCLEVGLGEEAQVRGLLLKYLSDLLERQQANGGWSYYLSGSVGGAAIPQSISFTTATVVMAIQRAAEVGCAIERDVLSRGLDCLEAMRSPHETFGYFLHGKDVKTGTRSGDSMQASAARGPACGLALLRGLREKPSDMHIRLEHYVEHLPTFGAQRRKALMHAGLHTEGSHYLLYDYSTAAALMQELGREGLPARLGRKLHETLIGELRACRNQDGSFLDNPLIGVNIGTGLGLLCLLDMKLK